MRPVQGELVAAFTVTPTTEAAPEDTEMAEVASKWALQNGLFLGKVLENRELQAGGGERSTHHVEIQLPAKMGYTAGDHLAVLGGNPPEVVEQAAAALGLGLDDVVRVSKAAPALEAAGSCLVPESVPLAVRTILTWCVELQHPAPRAQVAILADRAACPPEKAALQAAVAGYEADVLKNRRTLVELLAAHRSARLSLDEILTVLPPLKPRYYSISSSPRVAADRVSVTVGVVQGATPMGRVHVGVCSNFLARRGAGQPVRCFVKDTKSGFRLPEDGSRPVILGAWGGRAGGLAVDDRCVVHVIHNIVDTRDSARRGPQLMMDTFRHHLFCHTHKQNSRPWHGRGAAARVPAGQGGQQGHGALRPLLRLVRGM